MILIFLAFCFCSVSAYLKYETKTNEGVSFTQWLSLIVSRGIYLVLLSLIILCVFISAYNKKKYERRMRNEMEKTRKAVLSEHSEDGNWITNLWKGPQMFTLHGSDLFNRQKSNLLELAESETDSLSLKEKLQETEITVNALKEELDIANKTRLDLETTMESMERGKSCSEEELRKTRLNASLELEEMKREINTLQRQLTQAQTEKLQATKDLEAVSRENRITDSALRDQMNLSNRLDEAKEEIKKLKEMLGTMKSERDTAVRVASELVTKARGATRKSDQSRKLIRGIFEATSRTSAFSLDASGDSSNFEYYSNSFEDSEVGKTIDEPRDADNVNDIDEGVEVRTPNESSDIVDGTNSSEDLTNSTRLVTSTPEFRAFLQTTFKNTYGSDDEEAEE